MRVWFAVGLVAVIGCAAVRSGAVPDTEPAPPHVAATPDPPPELDDPLTLVAGCLERGDTPAACGHLGRYVRAHPEQAMFRLHLAELLLKADRPEEARIHFERFAADAQDTTGPARAQLVHCHTRLVGIAQGTNDRFGELFHRGVGLLLVVEQQDSAADRDEELCEGVLCKALKALQEAKELRPSDPRVRFYLAEVLARTGNPRGADAERAAARNLALPDSLTSWEYRRLGLAR